MLTSVGRFLRKLRIDKGEILLDMANKLGVTSAFLSSVENGRKKMPNAWLSKLETLYDLSQAQMLELQEAVIDSNETVELNIQSASSSTRQFAVSFARQFDSIDDDTAIKLLNILNNRRED